MLLPRGEGRYLNDHVRLGTAKEPNNGCMYMCVPAGGGGTGRWHPLEMPPSRHENRCQCHRQVADIDSTRLIMIKLHLNNPIEQIISNFHVHSRGKPHVECNRSSKPGSALRVQGLVGEA